jgi:hypothetical protein
LEQSGSYFLLYVFDALVQNNQCPYVISVGCEVDWKKYKFLTYHKNNFKSILKLLIYCYRTWILRPTGTNVNVTSPGLQVWTPWSLKFFCIIVNNSIPTSWKTHCLHYKDYTVSYVYRNNLCLLRESYKAQRYSV